ncbi:hypothetical protein COOONC_06529 [Cooperia oncophora]
MVLAAEDRISKQEQDRIARRIRALRQYHNPYVGSEITVGEDGSALSHLPENASTYLPPFLMAPQAAAMFGSTMLTNPFHWSPDFLGSLRGLHYETAIFEICFLTNSECCHPTLVPLVM